MTESKLCGDSISQGSDFEPVNYAYHVVNESIGKYPEFQYYGIGPPGYDTIWKHNIDLTEKWDGILHDLKYVYGKQIKGVWFTLNQTVNGKPMDSSPYPSTFRAERGQEKFWRAGVPMSCLTINGENLRSSRVILFQLIEMKTEDPFQSVSFLAVLDGSEEHQLIVKYKDQNTEYPKIIDREDKENSLLYYDQEEECWYVRQIQYPYTRYYVTLLVCDDIILSPGEAENKIKWEPCRKIMKKRNSVFQIRTSE